MLDFAANVLAAATGGGARPASNGVAGGARPLARRAFELSGRMERAQSIGDQARAGPLRFGDVQGKEAPCHRRWGPSCFPRPTLPVKLNSARTRRYSAMLTCAEASRSYF